MYEVDYLSFELFLLGFITSSIEKNLDPELNKASKSILLATPAGYKCVAPPLRTPQMLPLLGFHTNLWQSSKSGVSKVSEVIWGHPCFIGLDLKRMSRTSPRKLLPERLRLPWPLPCSSLWEVFTLRLGEFSGDSPQHWKPVLNFFSGWI